MFSYSVYTFLGMFGDMLRFQVDAVVIASFIGLAAVTHYLSLQSIYILLY